MPVTPFVEVAPIATSTPLDAWGGWDGLGFDGLLFLSTGTRQGGRSEIWCHDDRRGDSHWEKVDDQGSDIETFNKIRDGLDPSTGQPRLWVWAEGPDGDQSWLRYRELGSPSWNWETIPHSGNSVGGRGLGVAGPLDGRLYVGGSDNWATSKDGRVYVKSGGAFSLHRHHAPSLLWELEFEGHGGPLWEFWSGFAGGAIAHTYRGGAEVPNPPGEDISHAAWFQGAMYVVGDLSDQSAQCHRSTGGDWDHVVSSSVAGSGDHVVAVPRGAGELWIVFQNPLQVLRSFDGDAWEEATLPRVAGGGDTNHLAALAYYGGRVWVLARDASQGRCRVFREAIGSTLGGGRGLLQIA